ncbi:MAG: alginate O-acetyltransferase AlgX-related protein [Woeseiaceae bacterium]
MAASWQGLMKRLAKVFALQVLVAICVVVLFDTAAYLFLPKDAVRFAPKYRQKEVRAERNGLLSQVYDYPKGYFRADVQLGFDIAANVGTSRYAIGDSTFDIFSNSLGCFDRNEPSVRSSEYVYFAGDSFTWGYARYEKKFATVYEARTGRVSLKCGVTHTGQRHQYRKFSRIAQALGRYPTRVFVGYFINDPANDFAHPHSTVIDGFLVDVVELKNGALVQRNLGKIAEAIHNAQNGKNAAAHSGAKSVTRRLREFLRRYSLTAHLMVNAVIQVKYLAKIYLIPGASKSFYESSRQFDFEKSYLHHAVTAANREAIKQWANDAKANGYELVFVLIPPKHSFDDIDYYRSLRAFLSSLEISYLDLTEAFRTAKKTESELYWGKDLHWNDEGNEFVGKLLAERFP